MTGHQGGAVAQTPEGAGFHLRGPGAHAAQNCLLEESDEVLAKPASQGQASFDGKMSGFVAFPALDEAYHLLARSPIPESARTSGRTRADGWIGEKMSTADVESRKSHPS